MRAIGGRSDRARRAPIIDQSVADSQRNMNRREPLPCVQPVEVSSWGGFKYTYA